MKFKTSVAVVICGLSTAAWAGAPTDSVQDSQGAYREDASVNDPSADDGNTGEQMAGWQYLNGQATPSGQNSTAVGQAAPPEDSGNDQMANLQSPNEDDDQSPSPASDSPFGSESDSNVAGEQPTGLDAIIGGTRDKLVVILPEGWQGSVPDLLAALEDSSDTAEILILRPDGQSADMSSESSEDEDAPDSK
jgi:hypothetical protein